MSTIPFRKPRGAPKKPFPKGRDNPNFGGGRNGGGRQKGTPNKIPMPFKQWLLAVIESEEYRDNLKTRIFNGQAGSLEILAAHWHGGKPSETHEIKMESLDRMYMLAASKGLVKGDERRQLTEGTVDAEVVE